MHDREPEPPSRLRSCRWSRRALHRAHGSTVSVLRGQPYSWRWVADESQVAFGVTGTAGDQGGSVVDVAPGVWQLPEEVLAGAFSDGFLAGVRLAPQLQAAEKEELQHDVGQENEQVSLLIQVWAASSMLILVPEL
ncbi:unnamed protein product, partial [Prorocentrum cordatum]